MLRFVKQMYESTTQGTNVTRVKRASDLACDDQTLGADIGHDKRPLPVAPARIVPRCCIAGEASTRTQGQAWKSNQKV